MSDGLPPISGDPVTNPEVMTFGGAPREHRHARRVGLAAVFVGVLAAVTMVAPPAAAPAPEPGSGPASGGITLTEWAQTHHDGCHGGELASRHAELRY
jgi:hypothetical protein